MNTVVDKKTLSINSPVNQDVKKLISICIDSKKTVIDDSHDVQFIQQLADHKILKKHDNINNFYLNENSYLLGFHLIEDAEKKFNHKLPLNLSLAIKFIQDYEEVLKRPRQNYNWCSTIVRVMIKSAIIKIHDSGSDLLTEIEQHLNDLNSEVQSSYLEEYIEKYFFDVLEHLEYTTDRLYNLLLLFLQEDKKKIRTSANDFLKRMASHNIKKAINLLEYAKQEKNEDFSIYYSFLLQGIYDFEPEYAIKESLQNIDNNPEISFYSLLNYNYSKSDEIDTTIKFIESNHEKISINEMPKFYAVMLEKDHSSMEQKDYCINHLISYSESEDEQVLKNLIFWVESITGFEKERVTILKNLQTKNIFPNPKMYFLNFTDSKPLFELIKQQAKTDKDFKYEYYKSSINGLSTKDPLSFNSETTSLLASKDKTLRLLGWQIANGKYFGMHKLNFQDLSEDEEIRAMNTLMSFPLDLDSLFKTAIEFFNSKHDSVKNQFVNHCKMLLNGYGENLIEALESSIDINHSSSVNLVDELKVDFQNLSSTLEQKVRIKEFDPFLNQYGSANLFYSLMKEKEDLMMEQAQKRESIFSQIATRIPVVRGNAFKSETNPMITKMQPVRFEKQLNKNYYQDPIGFEENI